MKLCAMIPERHKIKQSYKSLILGLFSLSNNVFEEISHMKKEISPARGI